MNHLLVAPILLPLLSGALLILCAHLAQAVVRTISLLASLLLVLLSISLVWLAGDDQIRLYALGNWAPPFGIVLVLDRLSAVMLLVTSVLAFFSLAYAVRGGDQASGSFHGLVQFLVLGVNGAFLTGDLFNLFVFFEVMLIASYSLLLHGGGAERARAGLHYVIINLAGSALFLVAVAALYGVTGSLNMADMAVKVAQLNPQDAPLVAAAAVLLLVVFGLKAAIVPLYLWLPRAYASASAPVAAMFAIMTKVGVYTIVRVYSLVFGEQAGPLAGLAWQWLWPVALVTLVVGLLGTLAARDLRSQVAYLVVVSVGTMLAGISLNTEASLQASFYYLIHSTWICGALFLLADIIVRQRGSYTDRIMPGPRMRQSTLLGIVFFITAISAIGMPPLSGFIGKMLLLSAASGEPNAVWLWVIVLLGSLVCLTALSRSGSAIFWSSQEEPLSQHKTDGWALLAMLGLLSLSVLLTLGGSYVLDYTGAMAQQLLEPARYIQAMQLLQTR